MNPPKLNAPFLSYEDIRRKAEEFLKTYHPSLALPIPIELIIDNHFRINIVPAPGIRENADVDGVLSRDFQDIWVDEEVYDNNPHRYRFTLAHEMGHLILHKNIYKSLAYKSFTEWKEQIPRQFDDEHYGYFESQANSFAGLVLVPTESLKRSFGKALVKVKEILAKNKVPFKVTSPVTRNFAASLIADEFDVSADTIEIRLDREKIWATA